MNQYTSVQYHLVAMLSYYIDALRFKFLTIFKLERCAEMYFIFWNVFLSVQYCYFMYFSLCNIAILCISLCAILLFYVFLFVQYCYFILRCARIGSPGDLFLCRFLRESPTQWRTLLWPKICCYALRWGKKARPDQPLCYCPNISANQLIRTPHSSA